MDRIYHFEWHAQVEHGRCMRVKRLTRMHGKEKILLSTFSQLEEKLIQGTLNRKYAWT